MERGLGLREVVSTLSPLDPDKLRTSWEVLMSTIRCMFKMRARVWLTAGDEATREPLFLVTLGLCDSRADERLVGEGMAPESYDGEEGIPTFPSELLAASMYLLLIQFWKLSWSGSQGKILIGNSLFVRKSNLMVELSFSHVCEM